MLTPHHDMVMEVAVATNVDVDCSMLSPVWYGLMEKLGPYKVVPVCVMVTIPVFWLSAELA